MPTLESINWDALFFLFKGDVGTRKSTAAASFPLPQYWVSWDKKMEGIALPVSRWGIDKTKIIYDDYMDWNAPLKKLKELQIKCPYKTIIVDSITTGSDAINRQTLKDKGSEGKGKSIAGIRVNSIEDFNAEDSAFKEMIEILKDIQRFHKVHIILIAHVIQKEMKSPDGETRFVRQLVTAGKGVAQKIPAQCSEVYHFNLMSSSFKEDAPKDYGLFTTHTGDDFARASLPLPRQINFNDEELYKKWVGPAIEKAKKGDFTIPK